MKYISAITGKVPGGCNNKAIFFQRYKMGFNYKKRAVRDYFIFIFILSFRVLPVFILFLSYFFCQHAIPVAMQHGTVPVFTKVGGDILLIGIKTQNNNQIVETLRSKCNQQQKSQGLFQICLSAPKILIQKQIPADYQLYLKLFGPFVAFNMRRVERKYSNLS